MPSKQRGRSAPIALVTGTSSGIGRAIAERQLREGWRVVGMSRRAPGWSHPRFRSIEVDLNDARAMGVALAALDETPTALVHAAGLLKLGTLDSLQPKDGRDMWQLHVQAAVQLAQAVVPRMAQAGCGRVVLVGSRVASGAAGRSQYAASKAALVALARSWAAEVVAQGVTVNVVAPAATDTPLLQDPKRAGTPPKLPPMGRLIQPDEVASLVAYLLSRDAAAVTGQAIVMCGGASL